MNVMVSKLVQNDKATIWNSAASLRVPALDALDMTVPFRGQAAARLRVELAKARSKKMLRAFGSRQPTQSLRKLVK
jgi:hypothetical protein